MSRNLRQVQVVPVDVDDVRRERLERKLVRHCRGGGAHAAPVSGLGVGVAPAARVPDAPAAGVDAALHAAHLRAVVEEHHERVCVQLAENECAVQYGRRLGFGQCVRIARGCGACSRGEMKVVVDEDEEKDQVDDCDGRGQGAGLDGQADEPREDRIAAHAPFSS